MKKKCMAALLTAAMMTSMMAGIAVKAEEAEGGTLKIMCTNASQPQEKEYITSSFLEGFKEETGIDVEVDFLTQADGIKKIQTEQETGNIVSDLLIVDTANMAPYVNGGWLEDISETVDGTGVTYTTMFDDSTNKDSARYFVPMSFDVYITIANVKALDYLPDGLTQEDVENGLTWEQYADWAIAIAEGEGEGKTMLPTSMDGSQLLYPMGGMSLAYGGSFPEFTSQGFKDAMGVIAKMAEADAFYANQDQYNAVTEPLDKGDVWLTFTHMGPAGTSYNAAPNNFVIGAAPKGSKGAGSTAGAWCVGIQKGSENAQAAQKFIEYISDPEVNYDYCTNMGGVLSPIEEVGDILESSDAIMKAGNAMLADTIISGVPSTEYSDWNAVKLLYGDVYNKIAETKAVPDDAFLEEMQAKLDELKLAE
ncbi:MAG: extracellular solute-binding protein [Bacillota bacterium]|nr:extracellular solute-binding protein [Bacillota bacterium]